jgi:predicted DNA-binding protein
MRRLTPGDRLWRSGRRAENRRNISLWLDRETTARLDDLAKRTGMTTSGVVAQIVRYTLSGKESASSKLVNQLEGRDKSEVEIS